jgi:hypothetical protein
MTRIALTTDTILFANINQTRVLEMIPLSQIVDLIDLEIDPHFTLKNLDCEPLKLLQITTAVTGFNRGRVYRFRTSSDSFKVCVLESIRKCAFSRQDSLSLIERLSLLQYRIRDVFYSGPVQYLLASLIMAVCIITVVVRTCCDRSKFSMLESYTNLIDICR